MHQGGLHERRNGPVWPKSPSEWELVCLADNCTRLHRLGAALRAA
jgi:hypothetical protein